MKLLLPYFHKHLLLPISHLLFKLLLFLSTFYLLLYCSSNLHGQKLYYHTPNLSQLKIFGCACYPYLRPYTSNKLDPRTTECIFLCYFTHSKCYLCFDLLSQKLYTSRLVLFNESKFLFSSLTSQLP